MAGIYVHIPFCKQACHYCDFHFSTSMAKKGELVRAIGKEIVMKEASARDHSIKTLYFGGGTPSLLSKKELQFLIDEFRSHYNLEEDLEFTLEANPDDLTKAKLEDLAAAGVNRLSIGVQSFEDKYLRWMNRAHSSSEALNCIANAKDVGIENLSIDLIYGLPEMNQKTWEDQLSQAISLKVKHISAYCLTVEPKTALGYRVRSGKEKPIDEETASKQFKFMVNYLSKNGFEQYEVSNFAKPDFYSKHNTAYWKRTPYFAFGPSAHGFDGVSRYWNIANNAKYLKAIEGDKIPQTTEALSQSDRHNEWIMTGLRTTWGVDLNAVKKEFGLDHLQLNGTYINELVKDGLADLENQNLKLTRSGLFLADGIASNFFILDDE